MIDLAAAEQIAGWTFRGFGVLYAAGGAFVVHNMRNMLFLSKSIDKLEQMMREADQPSLLANDPEDRGRFWWLLAGGVLTFLAGVAMLAGSRLCIYLLLAMIGHQAMYLGRQHRRMRAARSDFAAEESAPAQSTWNAFGWTFLVFGVALYLAFRGILK